jgi:hypothetical protein
MMLCDKDEAVMLLGAAIALIQQNKMSKIAPCAIPTNRQA